MDRRKFIKSASATLGAAIGAGALGAVAGATDAQAQSDTPDGGEKKWRYPQFATPEEYDREAYRLYRRHGRSRLRTSPWMIDAAVMSVERDRRFGRRTSPPSPEELQMWEKYADEHPEN